MEKGEPALVPEWLRNTSNPGGSSSSVHSSSSTPNQDTNGSPSGFRRIKTNNGSNNDSPWSGNRFQISDNGFQGQSPTSARTPPPSSFQNQRLEDMAIRQSRQLVPMTPSKSSGSSHCDKQKLRTTARVLETSFGSKNAHSPPTNGRSKFSNPHFGNLQVLKPIWECNPAAPATTSAPVPPPNDRRVSGVTEKRAAPPPAQSRNDFFELVRRKSVTAGISESESESLKIPTETESLKIPTETESCKIPTETECCKIPTETESCSVGPTTAEVDSGEEEEIPFLKSLGWEEKGVDEKEEDWALTHDEIDGFFQRCIKDRMENKLSDRVLLKVCKLPGCPSFLLHELRV